MLQFGQVLVTSASPFEAVLGAALDSPAAFANLFGFGSAFGSTLGFVIFVVLVWLSAATP